MYKLIADIAGGVKVVQRLLNSTFIPFDPGNTDYARFKREINTDQAELQDPDGNTMIPEAAKSYVATLP